VNFFSRHLSTSEFDAPKQMRHDEKKPLVQTRNRKMTECVENIFSHVRNLAQELAVAHSTLNSFDSESAKRATTAELVAARERIVQLNAKRTELTAAILCASKQSLNASLGIHDVSSLGQGEVQDVVAKIIDSRHPPVSENALVSTGLLCSSCNTVPSALSIYPQSNTPHTNSLSCAAGCTLVCDCVPGEPYLLCRECWTTHLTQSFRHNVIQNATAEPGACTPTCSVTCPVCKTERTCAFRISRDAPAPAKLRGPVPVPVPAPMPGPSSAPTASYHVLDAIDVPDFDDIDLLRSDMGEHSDVDGDCGDDPIAALATAAMFDLHQRAVASIDDLGASLRILEKHTVSTPGGIDAAVAAVVTSVSTCIRESKAPKRKPKPRPKIQTSEPPRHHQFKVRVCSICKQPGHYRNKCPKRTEPKL